MTQNWFILVYVLLFVQLSVDGSFWNEIPPRCILDQQNSLHCRNTTFLRPIPNLNVVKNATRDPQVDLRYCYLEYSLRDLFIYISTDVENLTLINNQFSPKALESNQIFEGGLFYRSLRSLTVRDKKGEQWLQFNRSFFPQLIELNLSKNHFTNAVQLNFSRESFPKLKLIDLSNNQLKTIENLRCDQLEKLILASNPLESISTDLKRFESLRFLDLSSTSIKSLFSLSLVPNLEDFHCRNCREIPSWEVEKLFEHCESRTRSFLSLDLSNCRLNSMDIFNRHAVCFQSLILNGENLDKSISTEDLHRSEHLEQIEIRQNHLIDYIYLNVYSRLALIDLSRNSYLSQVILRLHSETTRLQRLIISRTVLNDFSVDFTYTNVSHVHIDLIDLSHNQLETIDFLKYLTFFTLNLSYNRLKIIDVDSIRFRHGVFSFASMNLLNISFNQMEYASIRWIDESPHQIDLSNNELEFVELHGKTSLSLDLSNNRNLSLTPDSMNLDLTRLQHLHLDSINLPSLEHLIYLHNLPNLQTLTFDNNHLSQKNRVLNWQLFEPWRQQLTHLSMRNISLERLESGAQLNGYLRLLAINMSENNQLLCNCDLRVLLNWLKTPLVPIESSVENFQKVLSIDCSMAFYDLHCSSYEDVEFPQEKVHYTQLFRLIFILCVFSMILFCSLKFAEQRLKHLRSRFYPQVYTDGDLITLNERNIRSKPDDE